MKYLLDVNALIAYGYRKHDFHGRVGVWIRSRMSDRFLTCSITELGFVRVLGNIRAYGMNVAEARSLLMELKAWSALPLEFVPDGIDVSVMPKWVKTPLRLRMGIWCNWRAPMERFWLRWMRGFRGLF